MFKIDLKLQKHPTILRKAFNKKSKLNNKNKIIRMLACHPSILSKNINPILTNPKAHRVYLWTGFKPKVQIDSQDTKTQTNPITNKTISLTLLK